MKFYWPEEDITNIYPIGARIRGLIRKGRRPATCTFEPIELIEFYHIAGPDKFIDYLNLCKAAIRK